MGKNLSLLITLLFCQFLTFDIFAQEIELGPLINRQFKEIQDLKKKVSDLESVVKDIQLSLKKNEVSANKSSQNITPIVGENVAIEPTLKLDSDNNFLNINNQSKIISDADKNAYDLALASLKKGNFVSAEKQFADFISNHPTSKLHSNALFWYAETFYRRENFNKSAINYLQCYKQFPKDIKAPDALLKLSYSLYALNKSSEACNIIGKLETEFPNRSANLVKRSKEAKLKFQCK